jgi:excisionase family DNA binding protein
LAFSVMREGRNLGAMQRPIESEKLLTPSEVASLFRVDPKTVTRWAKAGKLTSIRTLGGHRRYRESEVRNLLKNLPNG